MSRAIPSPVALTLALTLLSVPALAVDPEQTHESGHDVEVGFGIDLFSFEREGERSRLKILDLLVFDFFDFERETPERFRLEFLNAPLVSGYESERDGDSRSVRVLDLPLFSLYESDRDSDGSETHVLKLPLIGSLYSHERRGDRTETNVLFLIRIQSQD